MCGHHGDGNRSFGETGHCHNGGILKSGSDCGGNRGFSRRFRTRSDQQESLKVYLADLQAEAAAVQERITELE